MIIEYHRPSTLEETIRLLRRKSPRTIPMGGGTSISNHNREPVAVVDLQALGLNEISSEGNLLRIGAASKLEDILNADQVPEDLKKALLSDYTLNLRNQATLGGVIAAENGKSILLTVLLALDARLVIAPNRMEIPLGEWLPLRKKRNESQLILEVLIAQPPVLKWERVARSPADKSIIIVAAGRWPSGRIRISAGGWGETPVILFDGPVQAGIENVIASGLTASEDGFASADYRMEAGRILAKRVVN